MSRQRDTCKLHQQISGWSRGQGPSLRAARQCDSNQARTCSRGSMSADCSAVAHFANSGRSSRRRLMSVGAPAQHLEHICMRHTRSAENSFVLQALEGALTQSRCHDNETPANSGWSRSQNSRSAGCSAVRLLTGSGRACIRRSWPMRMSVGC